MLVVASAGLLAVAEASSNRARVQIAADAAALAGAAEDRLAAERLAAANGAELIDFRLLAIDVYQREVRVRVVSEGLTATATAERYVSG